MSPLYLGIGNADRGDDAVGVWLAEMLAAQGHEARVCRGDATELMQAWEGRSPVIVLDAMRAGVPCGTVRRFDARDEAFPQDHFTSSHEFGLAQAIELGRALDELPDELIVFGVEGRNFTMGAPMSPEVRKGASELLAILMEDDDA